MEKLDVYRFEVGTIINEKRNIIMVTNDADKAIEMFGHVMFNHRKNVNNDVEVFVYDHDKNANIKYYDNQVEFC